MKPIVAFLSQKGVRLIIYLDEVLIMGQTRARSLPYNLGFTVNYQKSCLIPSILIELRKKKEVRNSFGHSVPMPPGLFNSSGFSCSPSLQTLAETKEHVSFVHPIARNTCISYSGVTRRDCVVEGPVDCLGRKSSLSSPIDLVIETDASRQGWGAYCEGIRSGGPWALHE